MTKTRKCPDGSKHDWCWDGQIGTQYRKDGKPKANQDQRWKCSNCGERRRGYQARVTSYDLAKGRGPRFVWTR